MRASYRAIVATLLLLPLRVWGGEANLDPSFGNFGTTIVNVNSGQDFAAAVVLQADGKIVAAGSSQQSGKYVFTVMRFHPDGSIDASYGTGGRTNVSFSDNALTQHAVLQPDGKVIVAGVMFGALGAPDDEIAIARLDDTGALDPTFGSGGKVLTDLTPSYDSADAIALQTDGKLVVGSSSQDGSGNAHFNVVRYMPDGSLDPSFGTGGHVMTIVGSFDIIGGVLVQTDGKIVAVGATSADGVAVRYLPGGALDTSFGTGGIAHMGFAPAIAFAGDALILPDGKIVISGVSTVGNFTLTRLTAAGSVDGAFATAGRSYVDLGGNDIPTTLVRRPDGRLVAAGEVVRAVDPNADIDVGVVTWNADGSLDTTFGTGGKLTYSVGPGVDEIGEIALQPDGKIVLAGETSDVAGDDTRFMLQRLGSTCGDGNLDVGEQCDDGNSISNDCCSIACRYEDPGTPCDVDADACTADTCNGSGTCVAGGPVVCGICEQCDVTQGCVGAPPDPTCKSANAPEGSTLRLKRNANTQKTIVAWKWKGQATTLAELGDPVNTTDYGFCLYGTVLGPQYMSAAAPAGGTCHGHPCWKPAGSQGFLYRDADLTPDGLLKTKILAGAAGKARATLKAKNVVLNFPSFYALSTMGPPLKAQLRARNGLCLEGQFSNFEKAGIDFLSAKSD